MLNRIITKGMGSSRGIPGNAGIVTQGYGGTFFESVKAAARRIVKAGQSGTKRAAREIEKLLVWAKLIEVNDSVPSMKIEGYTSAEIIPAETAKNTVVVEGFKNRIVDLAEKIRVTVKRMK
jgi:hypothetical protein